jgi:hypothetical protein
MRSSRRVALLGGLLAAWAAPFPALAQPEGRGQGNQGGNRGNDNRGGGNRGNDNRGNGQQGGRGDQGRGGGPRPSLGGGELSTIRLWLGANPGFVAQPLPPGMRNRLAQGKPLPPGIARRQVPPDLLGRLPRYPGHDYALIGTSLVLIELSTGLVSGILADAFLR